MERGSFSQTDMKSSCHRTGSTEICTVLRWKELERQIFVNEPKPWRLTPSEHFWYWIIIKARGKQSVQLDNKSSLFTKVFGSLTITIERRYYLQDSAFHMLVFVVVLQVQAIYCPHVPYHLQHSPSRNIKMSSKRNCSFAHSSFSAHCKVSSIFQIYESYAEAAE